MELTPGMKVHLILKESPNQAKTKDVHIRGSVDAVYMKYFVVKTKNYKTCINLVDLNTGHAVLC